MNFRFNFARNFLSPVNISRRIHAANCSSEFFMDIPWFRYLANLHEYWIERLSSFINFRTAEVPIHFPCRSIVLYLMCFRQLPRCRISTPAMPTQTWPRRAPPAGTAARRRRGPQQRRRQARGTWPRRAPTAGTAKGKKTYTTATTEGAGRGRRRRSRPATEAGRRRRRQRAASTGALPPGT